MKTITVDIDYFEHLLNCLANQKYNPTKQDQKVIDIAWNNGMNMLLKQSRIYDRIDKINKIKSNIK